MGIGEINGCSQRAKVSKNNQLTTEYRLDDFLLDYTIHDS